MVKLLLQLSIIFRGLSIVSFIIVTQYFRSLSPHKVDGGYAANDLLLLFVILSRELTGIAFEKPGGGIVQHCVD